MEMEGASLVGGIRVNSQPQDIGSKCLPVTVFNISMETGAAALHYGCLHFWYQFSNLFRFCLLQGEDKLLWQRSRKIQEIKSLLSSIIRSPYMAVIKNEC